jgi:hypothetical protein
MPKRFFARVPEVQVLKEGETDEEAATMSSHLLVLKRS